MYNCTIRDLCKIEITIIATTLGSYSVSHNAERSSFLHVSRWIRTGMSVAHVPPKQLHRYGTCACSCLRFDGRAQRRTEISVTRVWQVQHLEVGSRTGHSWSIWGRRRGTGSGLVCPQTVHGLLGKRSLPIWSKTGIYLESGVDGRKISRGTYLVVRPCNSEPRGEGCPTEVATIADISTFPHSL